MIGNADDIIEEVLPIGGGFDIGLVGCGDGLYSVDGEINDVGGTL